MKGAWTYVSFIEVKIHYAASYYFMCVYMCSGILEWGKKELTQQLSGPQGGFL